MTRRGVARIAAPKSKRNTPHTAARPEGGWQSTRVEGLTPKCKIGQLSSEAATESLCCFARQRQRGA